MEYKIQYKCYTLKSKTGLTITAPKNIFDALVEDYNPLQEEMHLLVMDIKNNVLDKYMIVKGANNIVMCQGVDIFRHVIKSDGISFALAHNHPSGDCTPSEADITFTQKVNEGSELLGLNFLDHVIYSTTDFYSMKSNGKM